MHSTIVIEPHDPAYPSGMDAFARPDKPSTPLYLRGTLPETLGVAIVGRRAASAEARAFTRELVFHLAEAGVSIWSGGAFGIDEAAHLAALEAGIPTVVMMGGGHDWPYPPEHVPLYERILESGGALLSRLPDHYPPRRFTFLERNRVLAALTSATVVIEAGRRSGARSTAAAARNLGKPLCVVPHAPWIESGAGCAEELVNGALAVTEAADILRAIGIDVLPRRTRKKFNDPGQTSLSFPIDSGSGPTKPSGQEIASIPPEIEKLGRLEQSIWKVLDNEPMHIDTICDIVDASLPAVVGALLTLTLELFVLEGPGGCYRRNKKRLE